MKARDLIPFLDIAYQGFGQGLEEDAYAIRALDKSGLNFIVSNSFSKIFSLYGERVGGLSFICDDQATAQKVLGQLKASPPTTASQLMLKPLGTLLPSTSTCSGTVLSASTARRIANNEACKIFSSSIS